MSRKEMCNMLCNMGHDMRDLEVCSNEELAQMCSGMNHDMDKEIVENQSSRIIKSFKDFRKTFEELSPEIYKRAAAGFRKRDEKDRSQRKMLGMSDEYEEDFLLDKEGNLVEDEKGNFIRKADASAKNLEDHAKEREGRTITWANQSTK